MDKQELKSCPLCWSKADYNKYGTKIERLGEFCNIFMSGVQGSEVLANFWNTRPEEDRLNARIKELEKGLQHIINHVEMSMQGGVKAFSMHSHWRIATKALNKGN